ncbi:MAG: hypothetical protein MZW92_42305, partial [Comamonadaceae bacterium]|nr:hypothetical protein [Comamonadaceae bacterium]
LRIAKVNTKTPTTFFSTWAPRPRQGRRWPGRLATNRWRRPSRCSTWPPSPGWAPKDDEDDRAAIGGENGAGLPGCRHYVEHGSYPERFTLDDPALELARSTRTLDAVARFEDYRGGAEEGSRSSWSARAERASS